MIGSSWIFPQLSANSDEGIYLLQADALREGRLTIPAPALDADAYAPWFAAIRDGEYVLKYTPVHAGVLSVGGALGSARLSLALIAAAQVLGVATLARALGLSSRAVTAATVLLATAPLFVQLSITFLPYGTSLALSLFAAAAAVRAAAAGSARLAAGAGFLWGLAFVARPYDAVLWGTAIVAALAWTHRRRVVRLLAPGVLGALGPLLGLLAFNVAVTGDPFQLPFNLLEPMDKLGFGPRRALPTDPPLDFTPARGAAAIGRNLVLVLGWGGGGLIGAGIGLHHLFRHRLAAPVPTALLAIWPAGFFVFWGSYLTVFVWDGALFLGPYYFLPMVAMLAIAGGAGFDQLATHGRGLTMAAIGAAGVLALLVLVPRLSEQAQRSDIREEMATAVDAAVSSVEGPVLVMLPPVYGDWLQNPWSFLRNTPSIDGHVVFAVQGSPGRDARVMAGHPDRWVIEMQVPRWTDQAGFDPSIDAEVIRRPTSG